METDLKAILADLNAQMFAEQARLNQCSDEEYDLATLRGLQASVAETEKMLAALRSARAMRARIKAEEAAFAAGHAVAHGDDAAKGRAAFPRNLRAKWDEGFAAY